jgi:hypothetical protein
VIIPNPENNLKRKLVYEMGVKRTPQNKNKKEIKNVARMAEWSKAVDLSPTISGCAGSNPASRIFFCNIMYTGEAFIAQR